MRNRIRRHSNSANPQSNLIFTIVISSVIVLVWGNLFPPAPPVQKTPVTVQSQNQTTQNLSNLGQQTGTLSHLSVDSAITQTAKNHPPVALVKFSDPKFHEISINQYGQLDQWSLLEEQYQIKTADQKKQNELLVANEFAVEKSVFLNPLLDVYVDDQKVEGIYSKQSSNDQSATFVLTTPSVKITRTFQTNPQHYRLHEKIDVQNLQAKKAQIRIVGVARAYQDLGQTEASMFAPPVNLFNGLCKHADDFEREPLIEIQNKLADPEEVTVFNQASWFGVENRYFMTSISATHPWKNCQLGAGLPQAHLTQERASQTPISVSAVLSEAFVETQATISDDVDFYVGPKKLESLNAQDPTLSEAIDFGIFSPICIPLLWVMKVFYEMLPNWGIAIILLTILVKILTYPINAKQYESMNKMKALQPEMEALKAKYQESDPMKFQEETMNLYRKHKVNPASGCLPLFLMMPVYMALYSTIGQAVELYQAPFFGWITDLSAQDPYFITPILLGVVMFVQARLQPNTSADPMQQKMFLYFMPGFFTMMMLFLPSGLVIYIFVNTLLGIVQQKLQGKNAQTALQTKATT
jgi:YidC/Oxa1 family membrane protein insertase